MSEERVPYTLPDEMTQLRTENRQLSERLDAAFKTIDGFTDASSFQWGEYRRRIAELEAALADRDARIAELEQTLAEIVPDVLKRIQQQSETIARQEADLRRLRHLDAMPYWSIVQVANDPQLWSWSAIQEIKAWVDAQDGDA